MHEDSPSRKFLAYAVCAEDSCRFSAGFEDIRQAPAVCPDCGHRLYTACRRCGMLLRTRTGICTNCGEPLPPAEASHYPTRKTR